MILHDRAPTAVAPPVAGADFTKARTGRESRSPLSAAQALRGRNSMESGPLPRPLFAALHVGWEIAYSLVSRPISFGNGIYVQDAMRSLAGIRQEMISGPAPLRSAVEEGGASRVSRALDAILRSPSRQVLEEFLASVKTLELFREYHRLELAPLYPGVLAGRDYDRIVIMIGPGIGLGDEIACHGLLAALRQRWPHSSLTIYSFFAAAWPVLLESLDVRDLVGAPLRAFKHLESLVDSRERCLAVFANFSGQRMLAPFLQPRVAIDILEVAVGKGSAWWLPGDGGPARHHVEWDDLAPNQHRALARLWEHLACESPPRPGDAISKPLPKIMPGSTFRLAVNPLTSKEILLTPSDWAELIGIVRSIVPANRTLDCFVYPGLTAECNEFAQQVVQQCRLRGRISEADRIRPLSGPGGIPFAAEHGIRRMFDALAASHLLIGMDTFSAHLAAHAGPPSLAFCLWRNCRFWNSAPNTLWLDLALGRAPAREMLRLLVRAVMGMPFTRLAPLRSLETYWKIATSIVPAKVAENPGERRAPCFRDWLRCVDEVWQALPAAHRELLTLVDAAYAWPALRVALGQPKATVQELRSSVDRLGDSTFFRLIHLCARPRARRGDRS